MFLSVTLNLMPTCKKKNASILRTKTFHNQSKYIGVTVTIGYCKTLLQFMKLGDLPFVKVSETRKISELAAHDYNVLHSHGSLFLVAGVFLISRRFDVDYYTYVMNFKLAENKTYQVVYLYCFNS